MRTETPPSIPELPVEDQRLHAWSWLFVALQYLKQFIVPLLMLLLARRGDSHALWPLLGVAILVVISLWQYFNYRYRLLADRIEIRSGLMARKLRQIAYARIHNVALHQTLLHRLFGVAEVRLESAGGTQPEAHMRVLSLDKALALEQLVRERGQQIPGAMPMGTAAEEKPSAPLLALSTTEIIRHGLISNRGMVVVAAAFATLSQFFDDLVEGFSEPLAQMDKSILRETHIEQLELDWVDYSLIAFALLVFTFVMLRLFSMALSLLQYHGFVLAETGRRLTVSRGLLSRIRSSIPKRRIQAWHLRETWLHRRFNRRALSVETAVSAAAQQQERATNELAPIATPAVCDALINHLLSATQWPPTNWQKLHRLTGLRRWLGTCLWLLPLTVVAVWKLGAWGLLLLAWLPLSAFLVWQAIRHAGWSLTESVIATRQGWLSKQWRFAEVEKLQCLRLSVSPLDKLFGMRTLLLDTAGANPFTPLRIRYLPRQQAEQLLDVLSRQLARSPLRW